LAYISRLKEILTPEQQLGSFLGTLQCPVFLIIHPLPLPATGINTAPHQEVI